MSSDQVKKKFDELEQKIKEMEATIRYMKRQMRKQCLCKNLTFDIIRI